MSAHRTGCSALRVNTTGNARSWQHRPSDHLAGNRLHTYGRILPMEAARPSLLARLLGRRG